MYKLNLTARTVPCYPIWKSEKYSVRHCKHMTYYCVVVLQELEIELDHVTDHTHACIT